MSTYLPPHFLVVGQLKRTFLLPPNGKPYLDKPGGNLLYAAAGLTIWEERVGLVARVGDDYPQQWIDDFYQAGFDTRGIRIMPESIDLREFIAYTDLNTRHTDNPVAHFARVEIPFPKALFGYRDTRTRLDNRTQMAITTVRQMDLPVDFMHATSVHFCPGEYLSHSLLPAVLRQSGFTTLTLDPASSYMDPVFWDLIPPIVNGLTAFLVSEDKLRALFRGRSEDLWEMAEALAAYGCEIIVIKRGLQGQYLYDAGAKIRWEIPSYPARISDPTGAGDSFSGGFLAGYRRTYYPIEAVLYGNISSSLAVEGSGPLFILDALPQLAEARLEALRSTVRRV